MNVYLAGKIKAHDWRHGIVSNLRDAVVNEWGESWPVLPDAIAGTHNYVGPFFIACDHRCYHGRNTHGVGAVGGGCGGTGPADKGLVVERCIQAIKKADFVFAWIESADCYGTLFELGYAKGIGKTVAVAVSNGLGISEYHDLWFMLNSFGGAVSIEKSPEASLRGRLLEFGCYRCGGAQDCNGVWVAGAHGSAGEYRTTCAPCRKQIEQEKASVLKVGGARPKPAPGKTK